MSAATYRWLVLASVFFMAASTAVALLVPSLIPVALTVALESEPVEGFLADHPFIMLALTLPWLIAGLASTVGLLFFRHWARTVALYSTVLGFVFYPFFGPTVTSALANALSEASYVLWGAVLALSFYGPISERFVADGKS